MSERKTTEIKLRVSPAEKTAWQAEAEQEGIGLSELIRREMNARAQITFLDPAVLVNNAIESLCERGAGDSGAVAQLEAIRDSDTKASVAPTSVSVSLRGYVPTSGVAGSVAKPWTFEGRNSE